MSTRPSSFSLQATEVVSGEVHDRPPEIEPESFRLAKVVEPSERSYKGVLDEILGEMPVSGQEVRELDGVGSVEFIELGGLTST
jgi:hypothetical protein